MEEFAKENIYVLDLGHTDNVSDLIFELSNKLDNPEIKNKRICLKLGAVNLSQSQLLSIKALISGVESTLSSVDTKSPETEKVALSLGIIVSNVLAENTVEVNPEMTYKTAEEMKENISGYEITEEPVTAEPVKENNDDASVETPSSQEEINSYTTGEQVIKEDDIDAQIDNKNEEFKDELDAIFGDNPVDGGIFANEFANEKHYEAREPISEITVPVNSYTKEDIELEEFPTKYIKQTIRSGQVINYEGNIVIIGDCNPGCEITAFGDITVWGILSGIAHAGAGGNKKARIRTLKMNAIQLRIANCYSRRPDSLNSIYIEKTDTFTPEEARIVNEEIVVFKIND